MSDTIYLPTHCSEQVRQRARDCFPFEACGLLVGLRGRCGTYVRRVTEADNLNRERPADRYLLDPRHFLKVDQAAEDEGQEVVGVWHSHPSRPAVPSATDLENAWGGWSYLIVTVTASGPGALRAWRLVGGSFGEQRLLP